MKKDQIIDKVEKRIQDLNYLINTDKTNDKMNYARQYAREELRIVLQMLKD